MTLPTYTMLQRAFYLKDAVRHVKTLRKLLKTNVLAVAVVKYPSMLCSISEFLLNSSVCKDPNSYCINGIRSRGFRGYRCSCKDGYEGNPYLSPGCKGKSYKELGYWSSEYGFFKKIDPGKNNGSHSMRKLDTVVNWPGDLTRDPRGWTMPSDAKKMRIGVPGRTAFQKFVKVESVEDNSKYVNKYSGFCIDVFYEVKNILEKSYPLPYEFFPFDGSYDDLVLGLTDQSTENFDAVVGDITILANRSKYVEFTQPFAESGLSMMVQYKHEPSKAWLFLKPFSPNMWLATFSILFYTMFTVWFFERKSNPEFKGPFRDQLGMALWFTFSTMFFAHITCAGLVVLLAAIWWSYKAIRRRNIRKREMKFFKRNGGLLLCQQISSSQGNVETTKLFTSKELEKATDCYNVDRIVGQGGQGTVYKGMLTDGRIVAVKKSKIEDESKLKHFINEVVILSQINHRNVVKLHGCCLQTEVPLLVYEFIPNGTLMQYIHEDNEYLPHTWDVRLRVATEVAGALFYLHSAASIPIYHRDIKSTNILLDVKYRAKVADFGTSKSFSIDQTHQTTRVQGTFGYLDPEYFQSSQFTDKSDVYSFGIVLVELLTGQKPILPARLDDEARGLATLFLLAMEENRLLDIIDSRIINEGKKDEMIAFANIAFRCLNMKGRKRPTMKQVVVELESIRNTHASPSAQQNYEEVEYGKYELNAPWESDFTSSSVSSTVYHSLSVDIQPLMTN